MQRALPDLRRDLEREGYVFSTFSCVETGAYAPCDVDWNHRDLPHAAHVHGSLGAMPVVVTEDRSSSLLFQPVAGLRLPLSVTHFEAEPGRHVYFTSFAWFVLFVESSFEAVGGEVRSESRIETHFHLGSPRWLKGFHGWIGRVLVRNHERLDREDRSLRLRRAALRARGYSFANDSPASYLRSLELDKNNVIPPMPPVPGWRLAAGPFDDHPRTCLLGSDGHDGIRIEAEQGELRLYPRLCSHDGACLDDVPRRGYAVVCPWHGRVHRPLARFRLDTAGAQSAVTAAHDIELENRILTVVFKG